MPFAELLPSGKYRAGWRDDQGRKKSRSGFPHKAAALRYAGEQESKTRRGELTQDGRAPTWGTWRDEWLELRVSEASTVSKDGDRIDRYLTPQWGNVRINRITRADVQTWVNELSRTMAYQAPVKEDATPRVERQLSPATVERVFRLFSGSMRQAVVHGRLAVSPCVGIKLPTIAPGHERYLTRVELDLVLFHLNEPYKTAVTLLAGTGMRFGELAGLHWQRVDLAEGQIDIVDTWDATDRAIKGYPKGKRRRTVPIVSWVRTALEAQLERQDDPDTCGLPHSATTRCRSGLVVTGPKGAALDAHNFGRREWALAVKLAGIGPARLHDCRHSFASWLVQDGVPIQEVQRLLGHASITTTQRYAHLGTSQHTRVLAALEG